MNAKVLLEMAFYRDEDEPIHDLYSLEWTYELKALDASGSVIKATQFYSLYGQVSLRYYLKDKAAERVEIVVSVKIKVWDTTEENLTTTRSFRLSGSDQDYLNLWATAREAKRELAAQATLRAEDMVRQTDTKTMDELSTVKHNRVHFDLAIIQLFLRSKELKQFRFTFYEDLSLERQDAMLRKFDSAARKSPADTLFMVIGSDAVFMVMVGPDELNDFNACMRWLRRREAKQALE